MYFFFLQDLSSPTKDPTQGPRSETTEPQLLGSKGIAPNLICKLPINSLKFRLYNTTTQ